MNLPTPTFDLGTAATFVLIAAGQIATLVVMLRRTAASSAGARALEGASIDKLADANTRIATALEKLQEWAREHDLDDTARWSAYTEGQKAQAETNQRLAGIMADLVGRITNVAMAPAVEVPATGRRAARR